MYGLLWLPIVFKDCMYSEKISSVIRLSNVTHYNNLINLFDSKILNDLLM